MEEGKNYVRASLYENAFFVAAANRVGEDVTMKFGGESMIVGPRGRVYASLETEAPAPKVDGKAQPAPVPAAQPVAGAEPAKKPAAAPATITEPNGNTKTAP